MADAKGHPETDIPWMKTQHHQQSLAPSVAAAERSVVAIISGCRGRASGTVIDAEARIVTADHLLGHSDRVSVVDHAGDRHGATIVGRDPSTDLALLQITDPAARAAVSPAVRSSEERIAVGAPTLALARSRRGLRASSRIIGDHGAARRTGLGGTLDAYIETDRALPVGFAGGPLVDMDGALIGMNTDGLFRGADLVLPMATIDRVVDQLKRDGRVKRGYLGVSVTPVRIPKALRDTADARGGALVLDVTEGSPAAATGLTLGDVLLELDGVRIGGPEALLGALADRLGKALPLRILRAGKVESMEVTPRERS